MTCCADKLKPPIDPYVFQRTRRKVKVQRKKLEADGVTANARNEIDYKDSANWTTTGERWAAFKEIGGSQADIAEIQMSVQTAKVFLRWDAVTGAIDSSYRLVLGAGATQKVYQVVTAHNWREINQWMILKVAEIN